jgi:hypothetical protein
MQQFLHMLLQYNTIRGDCHYPTMLKLCVIPNLIEKHLLSPINWTLLMYTSLPLKPGRWKHDACKNKAGNKASLVHKLISSQVQLSYQVSEVLP